MQQNKHQIDINRSQKTATWLIAHKPRESTMPLSFYFPQSRVWWRSKWWWCSINCFWNAHARSWQHTALVVTDKKGFDAEFLMPKRAGKPKIEMEKGSNFCLRNFYRHSQRVAKFKPLGLFFLIQESTLKNNPFRSFDSPDYFDIDLDSRLKNMPNPPDSIGVLNSLLAKFIHWRHRQFSDTCSRLKMNSWFRLDLLRNSTLFIWFNFISAIPFLPTSQKFTLKLPIFVSQPAYIHLMADSFICWNFNDSDPFPLFKFMQKHIRAE